jgi:hypothetical protein
MFQFTMLLLQSWYSLPKAWMYAVIPKLITMEKELAH